MRVRVYGYAKSLLMGMKDAACTSASLEPLRAAVSKCAGGVHVRVYGFAYAKVCSWV